jgi:hypothetical protein
LIEIIGSIDADGIFSIQERCTEFREKLDDLKGDCMEGEIASLEHIRPIICHGHNGSKTALPGVY